MRRRSCASTRNTYRTWNRMVGTVKKSTDTVFGNSCIPGSDHHAPEAGGDPEYRPAAQKRGLRALGANGGHSEAGGATCPVSPLELSLTADAARGTPVALVVVER